VNSASDPLDTTDRRILELLRENSRRTFGDIGAQVGLSAPAVKRRIDRLEESGVIRGYTTVVDHAKLGRSLEAFAELRFAGSTRVDDIEGIAADVPGVCDKNVGESLTPARIGPNLRVDLLSEEAAGAFRHEPRPSRAAACPAAL